jgi:hypothetical protein
MLKRADHIHLPKKTVIFISNFAGLLRIVPLTKIRAPPLSQPLLALITKPDG